MIFIVHITDLLDGRICKIGNSGNNGLGVSTYQSFSWRYDGGYERYGSTSLATPYNSCFWRQSGSNFQTARFFESGVELAQSGVSSGTLYPTNTGAEFRIGNGKNSGGDAFMNGAIGELIIAQSTNVVLQQKIEGYLAHKWGLEVNLPTNHPYKSSAPGGNGATANLDATVTDGNGETPVTTWSVRAGPGMVIFGDASAVDTVATFSTNGTYVLRLTADDGLAVTYDEVTVNVIQTGADTCTLTVASAYGAPSPSGVTTPASNSTVNAWMAGSPAGNSSTQYVCTGWIGTGSATNGTGTNTSFIITTDTSLTWQWATNYWIGLNVTGN
jgi:hypothetical protein